MSHDLPWYFWILLLVLFGLMVAIPWIGEWLDDDS